MYQSSWDISDGTQLYSTLALWLLWSLARSICSKGEQKGSTSGAHNGGVVAAAARRGSGFFVGRRQSGQARHGQAGEGMAWGTILTGHGVMNGASEIFFLFNWRCQKPFIHCTAKLQMVPWAAAAFYSRLKFSESSTIYHHHWTQWLYVVDTLQTDKLGTLDYQKSQKYEIETDSGKRIPIAVVFTSAQCLDIDKGLNHKVLLKVLHVRSIIKY